MGVCVCVCVSEKDMVEELRDIEARTFPLFLGMV
jgi:hypothetical protein